ncbi:SDR family NAD(P)-dependent oxidoreductase, partial [Streptomyces sp. NPDC056730]
MRHTVHDARPGDRVTGAASGMGLGISRRLAEQGHRVALFDRQGDAARQAVTELSTVLGSATRAYEVDVTDRDAINDVTDRAAINDVTDRAAINGVVDRDAINDAVSAVRDEFGPVEILVASAGIDSFTP